LKDIRRKYIKEPEEKNLIKVRLKLKVPNILALVRIFCPIHDIPFPLLQLSSWEAFCLEASTVSGIKGVKWNQKGPQFTNVKFEPRRN
jgi:hypothetical protein